MERQLQIEKSISNGRGLDFAPDFCPQCGNMIQLPLYKDIIECQMCDYKCNLEEYQTQPVVSSIKFTEQKPWLEQYIKSLNKNQEEISEKKIKQEKKDNRATINHECQKCGHGVSYFRQMQLRSADEGSTIFYQCVKCGFTSSQNN